MVLELSPSISCCDVGGVAILLDITRDRYFALSTASGGALIRLARKDRSRDDEPVLDALVRRGILRHTAAASKPILTTAPIAEASVLDRDEGPRLGSARDLIRTATALSAATMRMKFTTLDRHLDIATARPTALADETSLSALSELAGRFETARRYLPFDRSCLRDSLALLSFSQSWARRPRIVFGVRVDPFRAHCWIQLDGVLLNETVDLARLFTPILVR